MKTTQKNPKPNQPNQNAHNKNVCWSLFSYSDFFPFICANVWSGHFYANKGQIATTCCIHLSTYLYKMGALALFSTAPRRSSVREEGAALGRRRVRLEYKDSAEVSCS